MNLGGTKMLPGSVPAKPEQSGKHCWIHVWPLGGGSWVSLPVGLSPPTSWGTAGRGQEPGL